MDLMIAMNAILPITLETIKHVMNAQTIAITAQVVNVKHAMMDISLIQTIIVLYALIIVQNADLRHFARNVKQDFT